MANFLALINYLTLANYLGLRILYINSPAIFPLKRKIARDSTSENEIAASPEYGLLAMTDADSTS